MKTKILSVITLVLLLTACGTKKTAVASTESTPVAKEVKTVELTPELAEGKNLYENNCAKCHKLFEPKKFTKEEWAPILVSMGKKAKLNETQLASVTNYIHSQL